MTKQVIASSDAIMVFFYLNEGPRAHVHIKHKDGTEVIIWLDTMTFKKKSRDSVFNSTAMKIAEKYEEESKDKWEEIHGKK